jgi:dTDP-4-amino-4,6-dideoxygalactose transaminase
LQAAIGLAQLSKLDGLLADRQNLAAQYQREFSPLSLPSPGGIAGGRNSYFLYSLLVPHRDQVAARLKSRGIETRICYPLPLYSQPIFERHRKPFCPITEETCAAILNLPMFFGLTAAQQKRVAAELRIALEDLSPGELRKAV